MSLKRSLSSTEDQAQDSPPPSRTKKADNWVQCDRCQKWRRLPAHIDASALPDNWFCEMNKWDSTHNLCSITEEIADSPPPSAGPSSIPTSAIVWHGMPKCFLETEDRRRFFASLISFLKSSGHFPRLGRFPNVGKKPLDLYVLYLGVVRMGGMDQIIEKTGWRPISELFNFPPTTTSSGNSLMKNYRKYLYAYEKKHANLQNPPGKADNWGINALANLRAANWHNDQVYEQMSDPNSKSSPAVPGRVRRKPKASSGNNSPSGIDVLGEAIAAEFKSSGRRTQGGRRYDFDEENDNDSSGQIDDGENDDDEDEVESDSNPHPGARRGRGARFAEEQFYSDERLQDEEDDIAAAVEEDAEAEAALLADDNDAEDAYGRRAKRLKEEPTPPMNPFHRQQLELLAQLQSSNSSSAASSNVTWPSAVLSLSNSINMASAAAAALAAAASAPSAAAAPLSPQLKKLAASLSAHTVPLSMLMSSELPEKVLMTRDASGKSIATERHPTSPSSPTVSPNHSPESVPLSLDSRPSSGQLVGRKDSGDSMEPIQLPGSRVPPSPKLQDVLARLEHRLIREDEAFRRIDSISRSLARKLEGIRAQLPQAETSIAAFPPLQL